MDTDRNLLFGVIALQLDLIDRDQFAEACAAWAARKSTPLADLLCERGWLAAGDREEVERVLKRRIDKRGGDVKASLVQAVGDVRPPTAGLDDPEILRSLVPHTPPQGLVLLATTDYRPETRSRYSLSRLHAKGGIGQVWLARDESLGREVALKELRPERAADPTLWARFLKEAQITGQLEHPGIVPIYELGKDPDSEQPFYTMRFVRGRTLTEAIGYYHERRRRGDAGPLELRELLGAFVGVCNAVAYAHSRHVIHRDLKPANVVLGDFGEVMVLDWGLAKVVGKSEPPGPAAQTTIGAPPVQLPDTDVPGEGSAVTQAGQLLGTPAYMAPEQADGRLDLLDARTDVYGLGTILYELLTDETPFQGESTEALLQRIRNELPPRPSALVPTTPKPLEAIALKAMAKAPADRYPTAAELAQDVQKWLGDEPVTAYPDPFAVRVGRLIRRHRTTFASAVVLLFTVTVLVSVGFVILGRAYSDRAVALGEARENADRERKAREALDQALAEVKERAAAEARARSQAEKARGEAVQALSTLVEKVQEYIRDTGGMRPLRQALLKEAMDGFQRVAAELQGQSLVDRHIATAYQHMSAIATELGETARAHEYILRSLEINERVAKENPDSPRDLVRLGITLTTCARQNLAIGRDLKEARVQVERAVEAYDRAKASGKSPKDDSNRGRVQIINDFGTFDPATIDRRRAQALDQLGELAQHMGDLKRAKEYFEAALAIHQRGLAEVPGAAGKLAGLLANPDGYGPFFAAAAMSAHLDLGTPFFIGCDSVTRSQNLLGEIAMRNGDFERMNEYFLHSIELTKSLRRLDPGSLKLRWTMVVNTGRLGELCISAGYLDRAEDHCRTALRLARDLRDVDPGGTEHDLQVALAHYRIGVVLDKKGQREQAIAQFKECRRIRENLANWQPRNSNYQKQVMLVLPRVGEHEAAVAAAERSRGGAEHPSYLLELAAVYSMSIAEVGRDKQSDALTDAEKRLRQRYIDKCLGLVREAVELGFSDWGYLQIEVDLDNIRPHPEFQAIVAKMKAAGK